MRKQWPARVVQATMMSINILTNPEEFNYLTAEFVNNYNTCSLAILRI